MEKINYITCQKAITLLDHPHQVFRIDAMLNPYYACCNRCAYCPCGSVEKIGVKTNFLNLLNSRLLREKGKPHLGLGTSCEPYSAIEKQLSHTRHSLELISQHEFPVQIFTKSDLIVRDESILLDHSQKGLLAVSISIAACDEKLLKRIEPEIDSARRRFDLLSELNRANIFAGAVLSPIIPLINDSRYGLEEYFNLARKANAEYVLPQVLKMSNEMVRRKMYSFVDEFYPKIAGKFKLMYLSNEYPSREYMDELAGTLAVLSEKYRVPIELPVKDMPPEKPEIWKSLV